MLIYYTIPLYYLKFCYKKNINKFRVLRNSAKKRQFEHRTLFSIILLKKITHFYIYSFILLRKCDIHTYEHDLHLIKFVLKIAEIMKKWENGTIHSTIKVPSGVQALTFCAVFSHTVKHDFKASAYFSKNYTLKTNRYSQVKLENFSFCMQCYFDDLFLFLYKRLTIY